MCPPLVRGQGGNCGDSRGRCEGSNTGKGDGEVEGGKELPLDQGGEIVHALARTGQLRRHVWVQWSRDWAPQTRRSIMIYAARNRRSPAVVGDAFG